MKRPLLRLLLGHGRPVALVVAVLELGLPRLFDRAGLYEGGAPLCRNAPTINIVIHKHFTHTHTRAPRCYRVMQASRARVVQLATI